MTSSEKSCRIRFSALLLLISCSFTVLSAGGVGEQTDNGDNGTSVKLIDYFQRTVVLPKPAQTIISLSPGITETIFALGYGDRLVGRSSYCDYPPEAAKIQDFGDLTEPDIEAIVAISPDIVIGSTHFTEEAVTKLITAGQKVAVLMGQESFQGAYDGVIRPVSLILGDPQAGESLVKSMENTVIEARTKAESFTSRPTVYYVVGFGEGGDWTAGGGTFIDEMIEMSGAVNIAGDVNGWSFSLESIVHRDPDLILVPGWAEDVFPNTPIYSDLRAVRNGNVVTIDENAIVRQGPRLAEGYANLVDAVGSIN